MMSNKAKIFLLLTLTIGLLPFLNIKAATDSLSIKVKDFYTDSLDAQPHFKTTFLSNLNSDIDYPTQVTSCIPNSSRYKCSKPIGCNLTWANCVNNVYNNLIDSVYKTCLGGKIEATQGSIKYCSSGGCGPYNFSVFAPASGTTYIGLCPPLNDSGISISASADANNTISGQKETILDGGILKLIKYGGFNINWDCGVNPYTNANWGDSNSPLMIDSTGKATGYQISKDHKSNVNSENIASSRLADGVYVYNLSCTGIDHASGLILNGKNLEGKIVDSSVDIAGNLANLKNTYGPDFLTIRTIYKTVTVHVGDVPLAPEMTEFKYDPADFELNPNYNPSETCPIQHQLKKGDSVKLDWTAASGDTVTIYRQDRAGRKQILKSEDLTGSLTDTPSEGQPVIYTVTSAYAAENFSRLRGTNSSKTICLSVLPTPVPQILNFGFVTPNEDLKDIVETSATLSEVGKPIQLKWTARNADSFIVSQSINGGPKKAIAPATSPLTIIPDITGTHVFTLEAVNSKYPAAGKPIKQLTLLVPGKITSDMVEVEFSADKTTINRGESATLTWDAKDAASVSINQNIGSVANQGTQTVSPEITTTYVLTANSKTGLATPTMKLVTIFVSFGAGFDEIPVAPIEEILPPPEVSLPTTPAEGGLTKQQIDLKVNDLDGPVTLNAPATFKLSWNINAYCLATGSWLDVKLKAGSQNITLKKNGKYTYNLYCPGKGADSITVNVVRGTGANANTGLLDTLTGKDSDAFSNQPMPVAEAAFSADQTSWSQTINVIRGQLTNIYIKADADVNNDGLTSRDESGFWTDRMVNGGRCLYNTNLIKGAPKFDGAIIGPVNPQSCNALLGQYAFNDEPGSYQYGLFQLMQNDNKFSNIVYATVIVENPPPQTSAPVIDLRINGNDAAEQILGTPANYNLTWEVTNANSCEASGSWNGSKNLNGAQNFVSSAKKDFVYTLTCVGSLGTTSKSITLQVAESPVCKFTALPPTINKTSAFITQSELSWTCDYSDTCSINPAINDATIRTYGTARVSPNQTTTYILTCNNSAVSKNFEAKVTVE